MQEITRGAFHLAFQITHNREDARDILQDALLKSLEHRSAPRQDDPGFRPWFYRVVHNQAIDWLRRNRFVETLDVLPDTGGDSDATEQEIEAGWRRDRVHRALSMLPLEQREIICLKDFHDFSYREIADVMGIEHGTVMSRLHRARKALKAILLPDFPQEEDRHAL